MALAVASTSTVSTNNADNLTITKPTGVAVGDLLLIIASGHVDSTITVSGFSSAIPELLLDVPGDTLERQLALHFLYRIADSSDVSASNYTIAKDGGSNDTLGNACMLRVTGWTSGNPVFDYESTASSTTIANGAWGQSSISISRPGQQLLIMAQCVQNTDGSTSIFSYASPQITSTDSNPTWTELIDASATVYASTDQATNHLYVAYAISSNTSTITAYQATITETTADNSVGIGMFLASLVAPINVTADVSHLAVTPTIESVTASQVTIVADASHLAITPTIHGIESHATSPTQWNNPDKPSNSVINNQNKP